MTEQILQKGSGQRTTTTVQVVREALLQRPRVIGIVLLAVITASAFVINHAAQESLYDMLTEALSINLESNVSALNMWLNAEKSEVQSWSQTPEVKSLAAKLAALGQESDPKRLVSSKQLAELRDVMQPIDLDYDNRGFMLTDQSGLVLATLEDDLVGHRLSPAAMVFLASTLEQGVQIIKPQLASEIVPGLEATSGQVVMGVSAVVLDKSEHISSVLWILIDPEQDFSSILRIARLGKTGESYAFDAKGLMLSQSRFDEQLKSIGLIEDAPGSQSMLHVEIRDPGGDLTTGYKPKVPTAGQPLTAMAAAAVSGESGINLRGYRDYRGVRVIGAWRWLDEYDFGVAAEMDIAEALAIFRPVRLAAWGMFILVVIASGVILFSTIRMQRLRARMSEVKQLGQYTLVEKLGEGGMGTVYRARHAMLRRPTAVKMLKPDAVSPETVSRFEREVQLTSQLTSPHTIEIYDYGRTPDGIFYYAMEYLEGMTLADLIELAGSLPPARVIHILRQVCMSLEEAHNVGLIHRDIKPLNIMLCQRGGQADFAKVLDFGLVKDVDPQATQLTMPEVVAGTPLYIAPERLLDPKIGDVRTDIYALGCVGFNLLTGEDVFPGNSAMELCHHVLHSIPRRVSECVSSKIPPDLEQLIEDCLAKQPDDRPSNAESIIATLDAITDAGKWDQQDARRWWTDNAGRIGGGARKSGWSAPSDSRVTVDFKRTRSYN